MRHPLKLSRPAGPRFHRLCFLCPVRPDNVRVALTLLTAIHFSSAFDVLTRQTACRSVLEQDRKDPASLMRVFASGATAGGVCALLQTPVRLTKLTMPEIRATEPVSMHTASDAPDRGRQVPRTG